MQVNVNSMMAHQDWMSNTAHNVANVNTKDFSSIDTTIQAQGEQGIHAVSTASQTSTDLVKDIVDQISIDTAHESNTRAVKAYDDMIGSLIDLRV